MVSRQHSLCRPPMTSIHEGLMCLFIVCETMFTIGESRAISHANDTEQQAQQVAANPRRGRFSTETPLERERRLEIYRQRRRRRDNKKPPRSRESIAYHSEGNVVNTATTNMYRGSDKILQLLQTKQMKRGNTDCPCFML